MKTSMKQLAAGTFIALLLLVGNVKVEGTELKASSLENIKESTLEIENWMINNDFWSTTTNFYLNEVSESNLEIENWMIDETVWNTIYVNNTEFVQETEENLELEDWMTNVETWNIVKN